MSQKRSTSEAIERVAVDVRRIAERSGVQVTHTEAVDRVRVARERGDRIREENR